jgi:predicted 3-demethylubiquinone-9 3-methyltransferase (glyoxalase superfamily)
MPDITPCLWFDSEGEDAAKLYISLFPNSKITGVSHNGDAVLMVNFELDGHPFLALNGGPQFTFNEAVSFTIHCADQQEVDHYWDGLIEGGGEPGQCGWLKDRYGVSWQIVPTALGGLLGDPDPGRSQRTMQAMLQMTKLDIDAMRAAADSA